MSDHVNAHLRYRYAGYFGVPDAGRYSHDWATRIDAVLAEVEIARDVINAAREVRRARETHRWGQLGRALESLYDAVAAYDQRTGDTT